MTKPTMELVEEYGSLKWSEGSHEATYSHHHAQGDRGDAHALLSEIRQRLEAMERERQNSLSAMRMACIALAHAACKDPTYDAEYKKLSDAIAAMAEGEG